MHDSRDWTPRRGTSAEQALAGRMERLEQKMDKLLDMLEKR